MSFPNHTKNKTTYNFPLNNNRILALSALGGALEFYDFIIFVFFTPIISKIFFST